MNRGLVHSAKRDAADIEAAIADFQKHLDLGGGGDQEKVERFIRHLKKKL
jgi:hypothetical protein